jgi:excisionase family DNA binding protein
MSTKPLSEVLDLLTLNEAARTLCVSRRTLERLIAKRQFPQVIKIGSSSRVLRSDLVTFVEKLTALRAS